MTQQTVYVSDAVLTLRQVLSAAEVTPLPRRSGPSVEAPEAR